MISQLGACGKAENLIVVFRHDWLENSPYYYIDMELCEASLEDYIDDKEPLTYELYDNPRLFKSGFKIRGIWNTWDIMEQISKGIAFLHAAKLVHRDLKPRNGFSLISKNSCSAVLRDIHDLESRGFRTHNRGLIEPCPHHTSWNWNPVLSCTRVVEGI